MLGQYTFGLKDIPYSEITSSAIYYGDAVGGKADASDAGAIDLKAAGQMYSLKARFNIFAIADVAPVDDGGTKGVVTLTPTVTTADDGVLSVKIAGKVYPVNIASTDTTATLVCDAIRAQVNDDAWALTGTSTLVCTQKKYEAYTYSASDWGGTFAPEGSGVITVSVSKTTDPAAPTAYGITFTLQHSDTKDGSFTDLVSTKVNCDAFEHTCSPVFEITMPSNCKRFVKLKVQGDTSATAGKILCAIEPKN